MYSDWVYTSMTLNQTFFHELDKISAKVKRRHLAIYGYFWRVGTGSVAKMIVSFQENKNVTCALYNWGLSESRKMYKLRNCQKKIAEVKYLRDEK